MKILLLEDDLSARCAMRRYLEISGHDVVAVGNPNDALALARTFKPEMLILDWELEAEKDGVDVARDLQSDGAPQVIFITGQSLSDLKEAAGELKVAAFFRKPVSLKQIGVHLN
ncbi:MAG: DNA-binding response OmpR family regulator [Gammaproteobacteria bacterium]|jgi:DNA-binding response OmpR family regulator